LSRRVERVQSLIRHELGLIVQLELKDPRIAGLVSITNVEVTPDLRRARVYFSVYGSEDDERSAVQALTSAQAYLRRELGNRLTLRYAPELELHVDHSMAEADQVNRLLKTLSTGAGSGE